MASTVASVVRSMTRPQLLDLLDSRRDLAVPAPRSLAELAERATTQASVRAAVDSLDAWHLRVLTAATALGDVTASTLARGLTGSTPRQVDRAVDRLAGLLLVLVDDDLVHVVGAAAAVLGPYPAGLAAPSANPVPDIGSRLAQAGPGVRPVLERLLWRPAGHVPHAMRVVDPDEATGPIDLALAHHLLRPVDDETVVLPREVSLHLRDGALFPDVVPPTAPPWPEPSADSPTHLDRVDAAAVGTALEAVSATAALLEAVDRHHPARLTHGGMARKDAVKALSRVAPGDAGWFHLALAESAGLIGADARGWLPTVSSDRWRRAALWTQWLALREAWTQIPATPGTLSNTLTAQAPATARAWRQEILAEICTASPGTPVDTSHLAARLAWRHPGWPVDDSLPLIDAVLAEAAVIGAIALGARSRLADRTDDPGMPERSGTLILQSDLTAIAPGPLTPDTAGELALLADRESTGIAGVRRFTRTSLRRALDAGWTGERVRTWWSQHSMTGVPQGLLVLLDDVVRDHGRVSVSAASAVLEVDDPAVAEALLRSPRATDLGLRRLGPTVLLAQCEPEMALELLREQGLSPIARDSHGEVLNSPAPARIRTATPTATPGPSSDVSQLVDRLLTAPEPTVTDPTRVLVELRRAQTDGAWLEVTHVDDTGTSRRDVVRVMAVGAGAARCVIRGGGGVIVVPVARVLTAVRTPS